MHWSQIASPSLEVCAFKNQFINRIITLILSGSTRNGAEGRSVRSGQPPFLGQPQHKNATPLFIRALLWLSAVPLQLRGAHRFCSPPPLLAFWHKLHLQERELLRNIYVNACSHYYFYILLALHTPLCCWLEKCVYRFRDSRWVCWCVRVINMLMRWSGSGTPSRLGPDTNMLFSSLSILPRYNKYRASTRG
jgi:hypothetical protein